LASAAFVVDASVVVRWLVDGPFNTECQALLDRCGQIDARLLAPTCLYSEVANALYRLCLAPLTPPPLVLQEAMTLLGSMPELEIILVDRVARTADGRLTLTPQWEQRPDGTIRDYRPDIYIRGMQLSFVDRRGSLFDMAYAALAEQAGTTMWTIDGRFYNGARAQGLAYVMHPGHDPLP
jgi:predicted nucleic acid-binding protein